MPPAIVAADSTRLIAAGEAQFPAAALALLRVDVEKQRNKEILRLKQMMPKFVWESLSIESREEVSQHAAFEQIDLDQDPNILWTIIRETNLTAIHDVELGALVLVQMKLLSVCPTSSETWRIHRRFQEGI